MSKLVLLLCLLFPLSSWAFCEAEQAYFTNALDLFANIQKLHEINKKLYASNRLTKQELDASLTRLEKGASLIIKSQKLYKECTMRDKV